MCGIVGYLGKGEAYPALIKGLKRLEYRGYDSAGVALISNDGALNVYKARVRWQILKRSALIRIFRDMWVLRILVGLPMESLQL